jgi:hypothetical protein
MSQEAVMEVIQKAVDDEDFRKLLVSKPGEALTDFDLSDEERSNLSNITAEAFDGLMSNLEERASRAGLLAHDLGSLGGQRCRFQSTY